MESALNNLKAAYPQINFEVDKLFSWSPKTKTVHYKPSVSGKKPVWSLLHEVAHALLSHNSYETDFELLLLEVAAWEKAKQLADQLGIKIDNDHIQDCIDTYRDWLYQRSACPTCDNTSLQQDSVTYKCFNCSTVWTVTASRFCRPYRLTSKQQKTPLQASESTSATFL